MWGQEKVPNVERPPRLANAPTLPPALERTTAVVPRPDLEKAIADILHDCACTTDHSDPDGTWQRAAHTLDASAVCDELERRGWQVVRRG